MGRALKDRNSRKKLQQCDRFKGNYTGSCRRQYSTEEKRFQSFANWPIPKIQSPQELAKAGFFYRGIRDSVECFYCSGGMEDWKKHEDPFYEHVKYYSECPFIIKEKGEDYVKKVQQVIRDQYATEELRLSSFIDSWPDTAEKPAKELAEAGFYYIGHKDTVQCFHCGVRSWDWRVYDVAWFKHAKLKPTCKFVIDTKGFKFSYNVRTDNSQKIMKSKNNTENLVYNKNYNTEKKRTASFENWPIPDLRKPEELSKIGFYYTGKKDFVRCFDCGSTHFEWLETEDPAEEHARFNPTCAFIRQAKGDAFVERVREKWRNAYRTEELRQESFKNWPTGSFKTPKDLAEAGFYYTGLSDQTQCFDCGIISDKWRICDDPWYVHAVLNPSCGFVLRVRGEMFMNLVERASHRGKKTLNTTMNSDNCLSLTDNDYDDEIHKLMNSSIIQTVLNLGFNESRIKQTLRDRLNNSEKFGTIEELFAAVMDSQKQDPDVSAWIQHYEKENNLLKEDNICGTCHQQGPIMILIPCGHLHSCCSCIGNLNQCISCKKDIEVKLEMFPK